MPFNPAQPDPASFVAQRVTCGPYRASVGENDEPQVVFVGGPRLHERPIELALAFHLECGLEIARMLGEEEPPGLHPAEEFLGGIRLGEAKANDGPFDGQDVGEMGADGWSLRWSALRNRRNPGSTGCHTLP